MAGGGDARIKELRYQVMLALYLPILLYSFSTFDLKEQTVAAEEVSPVLVGGQQTVVLGQEYSASAYLTAVELAKGGEVRLRSQDENVRVQDNEQLFIPTDELLAEGEDEKEIEYEVEMEYGQLEGTASRTLSGSFTVRRPELVARSVTTTSLYRHTANEIRIDVPGLENREIQLETSTGGTVDGRQIQLSPSGENVTVSAYLPTEEGERVYLGQREFSVIDPPRPQVRVLDVNGEELTSGDNISLRRPVLNFEVEPDREFAQSYPEDANYRIRSARVSIRRGLQASEELGTFSLDGEESQLQLVRELRDASSEDRIIIQLQDVVRINHAGQEIPVDLNESNLSYSFILS